MRFTRVTVVAEQRQVDASLPSARPVAEVLPLLLQLLSVPPRRPPVAWELSTTARGTLDGRRTLDESGVLDAEVLYLSPAGAGATSPYVDDVLDDAAARVDDATTAWTGAIRDRGVCALLGAVLVLLAGLALFAPNDAAARITPIVVAIGALALVRPLRGRVSWPVAAAALPIAGIAAWTNTPDLDVGGRLLAAVAALGLALVVVGVLTTARRAALIAGGAGTVVLAGLAAGLVAVPARAELVAAGYAIVAVVVIALGPQLALGSSRLVGLVRRGEEGERVPVERVRAAIATGQGVLNATVWPIAAAAAVAGWVLVGSSDVAARWLGAVLAVGFGLRSRLFSRGGQVLGMLAVPVVVAAGIAVALPVWLRVTGAGGWAVAVVAAAVLAALVAALGYLRLGEVAAARLSRWLDRLEVLAIVALVPLAVIVFGGLDWIRSIA